MSDEKEISKFCNAIDEWARLVIAKEKEEAEGGKTTREFFKAWKQVRLAISKSCLLHRTVYLGEKPSRTPCPVHKGTWSGITLREGEPSDDGCRCYMHKCGCNTGWQPDEHCGCGVKP